LWPTCTSGRLSQGPTSGRLLQGPTCTSGRLSQVRVYHSGIPLLQEGVYYSGLLLLQVGVYHSGLSLLQVGIYPIGHHSDHSAFHHTVVTWLCFSVLPIT